MGTPNTVRTYKYLPKVYAVCPPEVPYLFICQLYQISFLGLNCSRSVDLIANAIIIFNKDCLAGHPVIVAPWPVMVFNKYLLDELNEYIEKSSYF